MINNKRVCEFIRKIKEFLCELNAFKNSFNDLSMSTKHHKFLKNNYQIKTSTNLDSVKNNFGQIDLEVL